MRKIIQNTPQAVFFLLVVFFTILCFTSSTILCIRQVCASSCVISKCGHCLHIEHQIDNEMYILTPHAKYLFNFAVR